MGRYIPQKKEQTIHLAIKPFYKVERQLEKVLSWLQRFALLEILGIIGNVGIIIAVATYVGTEKQRRNAEVLNAWQTITSASGQAGSGGRIQALEFLNASPGANWRRKFPWVCAPRSACLWPAESLDGINLAVDLSGTVAEESSDDSTGSNRSNPGSKSVYIVQVQLPRASLASANLEGTVLWGANLEGAMLTKANLNGANLWGTNLKGTNFTGANLKGADLNGANLKGANLLNTDLKGATFWDTNLGGAFLWNADLEGATSWDTNLEDADLSNANLKNAKLTKANFKHANLEGTNLEDTDFTAADLKSARNLEVEQVTQAKLCFTELPPDINLPPNRDCAELGHDPKKDKYTNLE